MFDTSLLLAHGRIGDLHAEADRERQANLVRSTMAQAGRSRNDPAQAPNPARRLLRVLRAMPGMTAR